MAGTGGIVSTVIVEQNLYAAQFSSIRGQLPGSLPWVERLRQKGMDDFIDLGFPTTKMENWKYTNVAPIRRIAFQPAIDDSLSSIPEAARYRACASRPEAARYRASRPEAARYRASRPELDSYPTPRLVFVNGWFVPTFSTIDV